MSETVEIMLVRRADAGGRLSPKLARELRGWLAAADKPTLCSVCNRKLPRDLTMLQLRVSADKITAGGICGVCARRSDAELLSLITDQMPGVLVIDRSRMTDVVGTA
jgi:hypothetical protein